MTARHIGELTELQQQLEDARKGTDLAIANVVAMRHRLEDALARHRVHTLPPLGFVSDMAGVHVRVD